MERISRSVINHKKTTVAVYIVLLIVCYIMQGFVSVNYDMNDYLPEETASTVSLDFMTSEFGGGIPNARVMVSNVSVAQALEYKEKLEAIDGVTEVTWLDDTEDITVPLDSMDKESVESCYRDGAALFTVTIKEEKRISVVSEIRKIIGDENDMTGSAVSSAIATLYTVKEIRKITAFAILFVIAVLILSTTSWIEPFLVLASLGFAIMINNGTNLIFGEISFVTNAAGSILQLAVSLDYSVFLIHRFEECRKTEPNPAKAMVNAMTRSASSVTSSSITTVIGFLALALMRYRLGPDLGLALAKGVAISLVTALTLLPCLVLIFYRLIEKSSHRKFMPQFKRLGRMVLKTSVPMIVIFALVIVPSFIASGSNDFTYGSSKIYGPDTAYGENKEDIERVFGKKDTYVLMVPEGDGEAEKQLAQDLLDLPEVSSVISYAQTAGIQVPEEYLDEDTVSLLRSGNYSRIVIGADVGYEGDETFALIETIRKMADDYYPQGTYLAGEGVSTYDLKKTVTSDMKKVNLIAIAAVFLILVLMMRRVGVPAILVLCIETAIWLNLSVPYFAGEQLFYIAYLIISSVQLGATVDYAILFTDRYKENRLTYDKRDAAVNTVSDVTGSILVSGSALTIVGLLLGLLSTNRLLAQLGILIGRGAVFSLLIVLFVLPGILMTADRFVTGDSRLFRRQGGHSDAEEI